MISAQVMNVGGDATWLLYKGKELKVKNAKSGLNVPKLCS